MASATATAHPDQHLISSEDVEATDGFDRNGRKSAQSTT